METTKMIAAGVLPICPATGRALLSKRHPHVMYGDTWASWGGKFEEALGDTTPQECAKREFWEETRIQAPYHFVEEPVHVYEDDRVIYYTFIGFFEEEVDADILTEGGLADQKWFPLDEFPDLLMPEFKEMLDEELEKLKSMAKEASSILPDMACHYPVQKKTEIPDNDGK